MNKAARRAQQKAFANRRKEIDRDERKALNEAVKSLIEQHRKATTSELTKAGIKGAKVKVEAFFDDFELNEAWDFIDDDIVVSITYQGDVFHSAKSVIDALKFEEEEAKAEKQYEQEEAISKFIHSHAALKELDNQRAKLVAKLRKQARKELK